MSVKMNIIDVFGGQSLLERPEFRDFYEALKKAQEISPEELKKRGESDSERMHDDVRIRSLSFENSKACVSLAASFVNQMPTLGVYCNIANDNGEQHGEMLTAAFGCHSLTFAYTVQEMFSKQEKATATAMFFLIDENGAIYYTITSLSALNTTTPAITDAHVFDPKSADGVKAYVSYARSATFGGIHFDYDYPQNKRTEKGVKILMPFAGSFQVTSEWKILGLETQVEPLPQMSLMFINGGGVATYNQNLASKIKIDTQSNQISWNLSKDSGDDDWNSFAPPTAFGNNTVAQFYSCFSIKLQNVADPTMFYFPVFTVESSALQADSNSTKVLVTPIHIYLGCFAKDTAIRMGDGSEMHIQNIRPGDRVATEDGYSTVTDIITGLEEFLLKIETSQGFIGLTSDHPIKTTQGYLRASDLTCGHTVIVNGEEQQIEFIYPERYDATVYNLILDTSSGIYANGFIAGDFSMQNEIIKPFQSYAQNPLVSTIVDQFKVLYETIKK